MSNRTPSSNTPRQRSRTPRPRGFIKGREWSVLNYNVLNTMNPSVGSQANQHVRGAVLQHIAQKQAEAKQKAALKAERQAIARESVRKAKELLRTDKAAALQAKEKHRVAREAALRRVAEVKARKAKEAEASEPVQEEKEEEQRGRPVTRNV